MSSGPTPSPSPPTRPLWKRIIFSSIGFGAGFALVVAIVALAVYWYYNHSRPIRSWPEKEVSSLGIKFNLKTKWRDGALSYQFEVSPAKTVTTDAFDQDFRTKSKDFTFDFKLYDSSEFELCSVEAEEKEAVTGDQGKIESLRFNSTTSGCSYASYSDARTWSPEWKESFAPISNEKPASTVEIPTPPRPAGSVKSSRARTSESKEPPESATVTQELWIVKDRWRMLQNGMTKAQVRSLLGEPTHIENFGPAVGDRWVYSDGFPSGSLDFTGDGHVDSWHEPDWPEH